MPPNMVFTPSARESSTLENEETDEFSVNSGCLDGAWEKLIYIYAPYFYGFVKIDIWP